MPRSTFLGCFGAPRSKAKAAPAPVQPAASASPPLSELKGWGRELTERKVALAAALQVAREGAPDDDELSQPGPIRQARERERRGCAAIITSEKGEAQPALARCLAFLTTSSVSEALSLLSARPARRPLRPGGIARRGVARDLPRQR